MVDDPKPKQAPSYKECLGGFVWQFSHMEVAFFALLCKVSKISHAVGQALFSGARLDALSANIRRSHEALGLAVDAELERALQQASILNGVRNDVVHLVPDWEIDEPRTTEVTLTNRIRNMPSRAKSTVISCDDLIAMEGDSVRIELFVLGIASPEAREQPQLPKTWQYKPPAPASTGRKNRKRGQKQSPPPQSSQG